MILYIDLTSTNSTKDTNKEENPKGFAKKPKWEISELLVFLFFLPYT